MRLCTDIHGTKYLQTKQNGKKHILKFYLCVYVYCLCGMQAGTMEVKGAPEAPAALGCGVPVGNGSQVLSKSSSAPDYSPLCSLHVCF